MTLIQTAINTAYSRNPEIFDRVAFRAFATPNYPYFMPALAGMTGHPIEPRWFVVDKRKNPVFSSKEVPTEDEILKQLDYAGIQKRSTIFRDYLRDNPSRDDALMKLFYHQYEMAVVKLRKHLTENGWDRTPFPAPELLRPLTSREDNEIWDDFADTLKLVIETEAWTAITINNGTFLPLRPNIFMPGELMALSPKMKELAARLLPKVTPAVMEFPESQHIWALWLILERASGDSGSAIASEAKAKDAENISKNRTMLFRNWGVGISYFVVIYGDRLLGAFVKIHLHKSGTWRCG